MHSSQPEIWIRFFLGCFGMALLGRVLLSWLTGPQADHTPGRKILKNSPALLILLGQILFAAMVYLIGQAPQWLREPFSERLQIAQLSTLRLWILLIVTLLIYSRSWWSSRKFPSFKLKKIAIEELIVFLPLASILLKKFTIFYTPSSDPDIHAYHAQAFMNAGGFFYSFPHSDRVVDYVSGFYVLNGIWSWITGLNPVTIVNIQPYLQWTLFVAATVSICRAEVADYSRKKFQWLLWLIFGGLSLTLWNPVFQYGRGYLEGTARLCHTGIAFLPWLLARGAFGRILILSRVVLVTAFITFWGFCFNPAHILMCSVVWLVAALWAIPTVRQMRFISVWNVFLAAICSLTIGLPVLLRDPFYRQIFLDLFERHFHSNPALGALSIAPTPASLSAEFAVSFFGHLYQSGFGQFLSWDNWFSHTDRAPWIFASLLLAFVGCRPLITDRGSSTRVLLGSLGSGWLMMVLLLPIVRAALATGKFPSASLVAPYHSAALMNFVCGGIVVVVGVWIASFAQSARTKLFKTVSIMVLLVICLIHGIRVSNRYLMILKSTSLGGYDRSTLELCDWINQNMNARDRILLGGSLARMGNEFWIFPQQESRAIGLYTNIPTAFFFNLDGAHFQAADFERVVAKTKNSAEVHDWLTANRITAAIPSGQLTPQWLDAEFKTARCNGSTCLWVRR